MLHIIHDLRKARGRNKKKKILEIHKHNQEWKEYLLWVYDSGINFYTSSPPDNTFLPPHAPIEIKSLFYCLRGLSTRKYTGNAAREFALYMSQTYGELARLALKRSIDAGISRTTINSIYPGLIPEFKIMLAKDVPIIRLPVLISTKYDGVRCLAYVNDSIKLFLRSGKRLYLKSLEDSMVNYPRGIYDGELVHGGGEQINRSKISGKVNQILKGTIDDIPNYTFCIFDYISCNEWLAKEQTKPFRERYKFLSSIKFPNKIQIVGQQHAHSLKDIEEIFLQHIEEGYEGIMLRYDDDSYEWKRTSKLIKKKAIKECILKCIKELEGTGKYEGMLGSLVCEGLVDNKLILVKVGTGLSDYDRELTFLGKQIEIEYNDIVQQEKSQDYSLFLPRFKRAI